MSEGEARYTTWYSPVIWQIVDVLGWLHPSYSGCIKDIYGFSPGRVVVQTTLPLDIETAVGLQILGHCAMADPNLELYILARLEGD